ncbi:MAG: DUF1080 domain-containing protein [Chitinophagaceae bacterium]
MRTKINLPIATGLLLLSLLFQSCTEHKKDTGSEEWVSLFNGANLDGWDIKITGRPLNDNYKNTFRVQDSMLRVVYDQYDSFDHKFGHLYYRTPYSYYKLRFQYRFTGKQTPGAPIWADKNSGVMLHSQSAQSVDADQEFPVSLEMQLLADQPTGNLCTPGTQVQINGSIHPDHCITSSSKIYGLDRWMNAEIEVYGDSLIRHIIEGDTVLTYTHPQIGGGFVNAGMTWTAGHITDSVTWIKQAGMPLKEGYLALQAESQPVDFRRMELLNLAGCTDPKAKNYKSYYRKPDMSQCRY